MTDLIGEGTSLKDWWPFDGPTANPIKRLWLHFRTLRVHWALGRVRNPLLNKLLDIYYSIRFRGTTEGEIGETGVWEDRTND